MSYTLELLTSVHSALWPVTTVTTELLIYYLFCGKVLLMPDWCCYVIFQIENLNCFFLILLKLTAQLSFLFIFDICYVFHFGLLFCKFACSFQNRLCYFAIGYSNKVYGYEQSIFKPDVWTPVVNISMDIDVPLLAKLWVRWKRRKLSYSKAAYCLVIFSNKGNASLFVQFIHKPIHRASQKHKNYKREDKINQ